MEQIQPARESEIQCKCGARLLVVLVERPEAGRVAVFRCPSCGKLLECDGIPVGLSRARNSEWIRVPQRRWLERSTVAAA